MILHQSANATAHSHATPGDWGIIVLLIFVATWISVGILWLAVRLHYRDPLRP